MTTSRGTSCYDTVERKVGGAFGQYGRFIARHPWKVLIIVVVVNLLLGLGLLRLNQVIDIEEIYTPINSEARQASERVEEMFPDLSGSAYFRYQMKDAGLQGEVIVKPRGGNILDVDFLREVKTLYEFLLTISTTDEHGNDVELSEICARNSGACAVDGDFFTDDEFLAQVTVGTVSFPYFLHPSRGPIYFETLVGGANVSGSVLQSATMLLLRINLRTDSPYYIDTAKQWQDSFIDKIEGYTSDSFDFAYSHKDSVSEELHDTVMRDLGLFTLTFTLMVVYAVAATFTARRDCVGQRCMLGIAGVLAAGLALLSSMGLCSACGVDFVSIVGVVPFLILGIGVDDMFILMSGMAETRFTDDVETRLGVTMATSGVSITITSLTDLLAFAAGASSVFPGVRNFCIYCAVAVVFCYINQASMFLACLAIDEQRTAANRHFATCRPVSTPEEAKAAGKSPRHVFCCTGRKPRDKADVESLLDKIPKWLIPKLVLPTFMKVIILFIFTGYLGASVYGLTKMEQGFNIKQLVAEDSYFLKFKNWQDDNFPALIAVAFVVESPVQYSDVDVQTQIEDFLQTVKNEPTIKGDFEINWLSAFKQYSGYDDSSEAAFISSLKSFLAIATHSRFQNDVVIDDINNAIVYSRFYVMSESITESQAQGDFMTRMRELADESSLPVFAHSGLFIFFEQFNVILSQTLQTVGIAIAAVFLVTCIFMPHPLMLILITVAVAMITAGIFGFLYFLDRRLSAITMTNIIMSVGFSVDFSAHICHGYMISSGRDRNERTKAGILRSGAPIFHGAMSSIIGIVALAAGKSFIAITFFRVMLIVLVFAIAHALLLLPVILSLIGPMPSKKRQSESANKTLSTYTSSTQKTTKNPYIVKVPYHIESSQYNEQFPHNGVPKMTSSTKRAIFIAKPVNGRNGVPKMSGAMHVNGVTQNGPIDDDPTISWHRREDGKYALVNGGFRE